MTTDNNKKDKRFSKLLSTIEKGKVLPDKKFLAQLRDKSVEEFKACSVEKKDHSQAKTISIWRIIMNSKITKFAAAAVMLIVILIGISQFGGSVDGSSVAFGRVLEYFQTFSYTFDLTVDTGEEKQDQAAFTMQAMVWESGRMRVDASIDRVGKISSIIDFNTGKNLLLFHNNKTAVIKKESVLNQNTGAGGMVSFCSKPIENLLSLLDGEEEYLGEKEIDGQHVTGFRVFQEDQDFEYDITIWVDSQSGVPSLVVVLAKSFDESYPLIKWTMENFDLDVELDEKLFSFDVANVYKAVDQFGKVIKDGLVDNEDKSIDEENDYIETAPEFLIKPLEGIGTAKFGMTREQIIEILGEPDQLLGKHCLDYSSTIGLSLLVHSKRGLLAIDCWSQTEKSTEGHLCGADFAGKTHEGIGINSTKKEIIRQYGDDFEEFLHKSPDIFALYYSQLNTIFQLRNNKVIHVSLDMPQGYTLAYQEDLETLEVETEPSDESEKIVQMLELWSQGKKDEAIELLLEIDWTKQFEFGKEPYLFSMTEKGYVSLKADDQRQVMENIMVSLKQMKQLLKETEAWAKDALANGNYQEAELYFNAGVQLGRFASNDPDRTSMVRLFGISVEKKFLNEMINLHTATNDREKLQVAKEQFRMAKAKGEKIKREAIGQ